MYRSALIPALLLGLAVPATAPAAGERVFVPLGSMGQILVIDPASDRVVGRIDGVPAAHGLAGTPDGRLLVVGSFDERGTAEAMPERPAGVGEDEHAAHHGKAARAPAGPASTVSIVDVDLGEVARRIDVPGAVHHVAVSPQGRLAVVTQPNAGTITAIDLDRLAVVATVATGPLPNYAVFALDGGRVLVSNAGNGTVSEVDTRRWIVRRNILAGAGPEHVALSPDGAALYVNNVEDGTVSVIDLERGVAARTVPVGNVLHGLGLSADGHTLFVAVLGEDKLVAYDLRTGTFRSTRLAPAPYHLMPVAGFAKLYVSSADEPRLWVVSEQDLRVRGEIPIGGKGHQMVQLPGRQ